MFVYTMSKKRALRTALIVLAVFVGIAIGVSAILTAVNTDAAENLIPIYSVERGDNKIALTFDCAWGNSNTDELLQILSDAEIRATFFVTGEFCEKYPDDVRKFYDAGHEIANHSDTHPHIKGININEFINDVKECSRKIKMLTGNAPSLYRAPYGEYDNNTVTTITGMSMNFIQWSVDSIDWQEPDAATITKRVVDKTVSGSILLFHNDLANTTEALPNVITSLKQKGFSFVKVSELIYKNNFTIDHTGKQIQTVNTIISGTNTYSSNLLVNEALEVIRSNLSFEEISTLKSGITPQAAAKITPVLTTEQIDAISKLSTEEYELAWKNLMAVIAREDAALAVIENMDESGTIGEAATEDNGIEEEGEAAEEDENLYDEIEDEEGDVIEDIENDENNIGIDMTPYLNDTQLDELYELYSDQVQEEQLVKGEAEEK